MSRTTPDISLDAFRADQDATAAFKGLHDLLTTAPVTRPKVLHDR